ncbi:MAG: flagellin [Calditerrivibrio sp.]|uniref:flagellin N-terminal helical domain-containing protein n=1 Tax=Calditerrivibrio sp. TaxID=2792612 RepID=UPI003D0A8205
MAVSIYNNLMSLNAQRHITATNNMLGKSLERLSSGLRINHASDDASGMAISEKLRGQISGLKRSIMNAQDGISMLQTAEGALEEVSSMLQRMRELAVQAANGTYTSNDRVELQKEVEQLKSEINRISAATEFNTKKLLNGDGTALWSASENKINAIIRGNVAEGNYEISLKANKIGKNQIFKTDIMTLQEGKIGAEYKDSTANATYDTNIKEVREPKTLWSTGSSDYTLTLVGTASTTNSAVATIGSFLQPGSAGTVGLNTISSNLTFDGYALVEITGDNNSAAITYFYDAITGQRIGSSTDNDIADGITTTAGFSLSAVGTFQNGDRFLFSISRGIDYTTVGDGSGAIILTDGPSDKQINLTINFTAVNSLASSTDDITHTIYLADLDELTGNLNLGSIDIVFAKTDGTVNTGQGTLHLSGGGEAATTTTKLKDIARFIDADGNNLFENKQELTIWGNGKSAMIYLEADDTVSDFEYKMTDAIVNKLGLGSDNALVNSHLVDYISTPTTDGARTVKGTFIIQTALAGEQGEIAFSGDQRLLNALSLAEIQKSENNTTLVTIKDAHTGNLIGTDETGNDRVNGVINGIELVIDSRANVSAEWDSTNNTLKFNENANASTKKYYLHVVDNSTDLQIGPNKGQSLSVSIPQLDVKGLGIENVYLVSQSLAQRAIPDIDNALSQVVTIRATIGAQINRLEHTINNLTVAKENMTASESRIRDLDVAEEMATFTRFQILGQSGMAMLAQANQIPQMALQLLK